MGNRWRGLANGHRVLVFPIWLYCDDTSGNLSKKWNKHNSFLFTPAGLPRHLVHREYNIHFLSTSNIAPPLEMLDGIVDQLQYVDAHSPNVAYANFMSKAMPKGWDMGMGLRVQGGSARDPFCPCYARRQPYAERDSMSYWPHRKAFLPRMLGFEREAV